MSFIGIMAGLKFIAEPVCLMFITLDSIREIPSPPESYEKVLKLKIHDPKTLFYIQDHLQGVTDNSFQLFPEQL